MAIAVTVVLAIATVWIGTPRPPHLTGQSSGDPALADRLRTLANPQGHQSLAVAVITLDSVNHAAIGETHPGAGTTIQPDDPIAAGSIVKTFDG